MRPFLLRSGLKVSKIAFLSRNLDQASEKEIVKSINWLKNFYRQHCVPIKELLDSVPLSTWKFYAQMGLTRMSEQIDLKEKLETLKDLWETRPDILKREILRPLPRRIKR